jgi:iron complex outermembrane receptor protein
VWDDIISNYEGVHTRTDGALFASLVADLQPWIINVSLRFDAHSAYGKIICPSISTGYQFGTSGKIYATVGKAFRAPSYTELYINDGFNVGNPRLQPEIGWTYEIGGSYLLFSSIRFSSALFLNDQDNVIDYVEYNSTDTKYYAVNFYHVVIRGTEVSLRWDEMHFSGADVAIKHVSASYGYLDSQTSHDSVYAAKYSNNYPRHQISGSVVATLPFSLSGSIDVVYKVKVSGDSYTLLGTRLTKQIGRIVLNVSGTNLLNQAYEENVGVPLPGRWLWVGAELKVF